MRLTAALSIALGISVAACGSPSGPSGSGNLRLMITDAPFEDASALSAHLRRGGQDLF